MIISDVLFILTSLEKNAKIQLDVTVDDVLLLDFDDDITYNVDMIHFSSNKRVEHALQQVVYNRWLDTINDLPKDLRLYWFYCHEIGISDGTIYKGRDRSSYPMQINENTQQPALQSPTSQHDGSACLAHHINSHRQQPTLCRVAMCHDIRHTMTSLRYAQLKSLIERQT